MQKPSLNGKPKSRLSEPLASRGGSNPYRVIDISVSPDNFINWDLLRVTGKIKAKEEVVEVTDVQLTKGLVHFKVKVKRDT